MAPRSVVQALLALAHQTRREWAGLADARHRYAVNQLAEFDWLGTYRNDWFEPDDPEIVEHARWALEALIDGDVTRADVELRQADEALERARNRYGDSEDLSRDAFVG
jgi:hypothetical protein